MYLPSTRNPICPSPKPRREWAVTPSCWARGQSPKTSSPPGPTLLPDWGNSAPPPTKRKKEKCSPPPGCFQLFSLIRRRSSLQNNNPTDQTRTESTEGNGESSAKQGGGGRATRVLMKTGRLVGPVHSRADVGTLGFCPSPSFESFWTGPGFSESKSSSP